MKRIDTKIILTSLLILPVAISASVAYANEDTIEIGENESIYKYYALENTIDFSKMEYESTPADTTVEEIEYAVVSEESTTLTSLSTDAETLRKLDEIVRRQKVSIEKSEEAMSSISNRNGIQALLVGNNLGVLKFHLVQMKDQIRSLKALLSSTNETTLMFQIKDQISVLEQEKVKVDNFITDHEGDFSLLGWFVASL